MANQRGACCNPVCGFGCQSFFASLVGTEPETPLTKCVCGCIAVQHAWSQAKETRGVPPAAPFPAKPTFMPTTTPPAPSAAEQLRQKSQSTSKTSHNKFAETARERKATLETAGAEAFTNSYTNKAFNPAGKATMKGLETLRAKSSTSKRKKKRTISTDEQEGAHSKARKVSATDPPVKTTSFTFVLAEGTKAVYSGTYRRPSGDKIMALMVASLTQVIELPEKASNTAILSAVDEAFCHIPAFKNAGWAGWNLLRYNAQGHGHPSRLLHAKTALEVTWNHITWVSSSSLRCAPRFKNIPFIALEDTCPDILIDDVTSSSSNHSEEEQDEDEDDDQLSDTMSLPDEIPPLKGRKAPEQRSPPTWPDMKVLNVVQRLTVNLTPSSDGSPWWPFENPRAYEDIIEDSMALLRIIRRSETSTLPSLDSFRVLTSAVEILQPSASSFLQLSVPPDLFEVERFPICFGPSGLTPLIDAGIKLNLYLHSLFKKGQLIDDALAKGIKLMGFIQKAFERIEELVLFFRNYYAPSDYHPNGIRDLASTLDGVEAACLPVADGSVPLSSLDLNYLTGTPDSYRASLDRDFGSWSDAAKIRSESLRSGSFGIHGVLALVIYPIVNDMPTEHVHYQAFLDVAKHFCGELSRKILLHYKGTGKRREEDPSEAKAPAWSKEDDWQWQDYDAKTFGCDVPTDPSDSEVEEIKPSYSQQQAPKPKPAFKNRPRPKSPPPPSDRKTRSTSATQHSTSTSNTLSEDAVEAKLQGFTYSKAALLKRILTEFPHPDVSRRYSSWEVFTKVVNEQRWKPTVLMLYHPDKNTMMDKAWRIACTVITRIINNHIPK